MSAIICTNKRSRCLVIVRATIPAHRDRSPLPRPILITPDPAVGMVSRPNSVSRRIARDEDKVEVWDAAVQTWRSKVFHRGVLTLGINAASDWWGAAARRERADGATLARVDRVIRELRMILDQVEQRGAGWRQVADLANRTAERLSQSSAVYKRRLG